MHSVINRIPFYKLTRFIFYYSSKITFSSYVLLYAFFCTILTHSEIDEFLPSIGLVISLLRYFLTITFIGGLCLHILVYKNFKLYIDKYIIFAILYIASAILSIILNRYSIDPLFAFYKLQFTIYPFIASMVFIQILSLNNFKTIGNYLVAFALINIIFTSIEITLNWGDLTQVDIAGVFPDRNLYARHLVIAHIFLLINYLSQDKKRIFDLKLLFIAIIAIYITFLYSRSGYVMYLVATTFLIWKTKNRLIRRYGVIIGVLVLALFAVMTYKRIKMDYMDVRNSTDLSRISVLIAGKNMIKHSPLYGVGYRMAKYRFREFEDKSYPGITTNTTIHNIYINVFAEQGIIGLVFYLLFNFSLLYELFKKIHKYNNFKEIKNELFCFVSLGLCLLQGMVYHTLDYEGLYWIIAALCVIVLRDSKIKT